MTLCTKKYHELLAICCRYRCTSSSTPRSYQYRLLFQKSCKVEIERQGTSPDGLLLRPSFLFAGKGQSYRRYKYCQYYYRQNGMIRKSYLYYSSGARRGSAAPYHDFKGRPSSVTEDESSSCRAQQQQCTTTNHFSFFQQSRVNTATVLVVALSLLMLLQCTGRLEWVRSYTSRATMMYRQHA